MTIRFENKITYFNVYIPMLSQVKEFLDKAGYQYELLDARDIPEDQPQYALIGTYYFREGVCCIKSHLNTEDL